MAIVQNLSVLAVRTLFEGFCKSIGFEAGAAAADAAVKFLGNRFSDHSGRLGDALSRSTSSAWRALELSLAGDSWWDRVKVTLARREDQAFREQVSAFLRTAPLGNLPGHPPEFRQQALRDLRTALKAGTLTAGSLDPQALAQSAGPFARYADPQSLLDAEWQALDAVIVAVREAGYTALAHFLALRPHGEMPMLVVAVRYFFRRELQGDPQLATALSFAQMEQLAQVQEAGYDALFNALAKHSDRFEELMEGALALLTQTHQVVQQTHSDVQDIKAALEKHGQHLQAVSRALASQEMQAGVGAPVRREEDVRLEMLNALLTTPHRKLETIWPVHEELSGKDPRFYVHLAAWYFDKGEVRDHKEAFVVALALSGFPGHRDVGLALLRQLPPYQVARVVDFIHGRKDTRRKVLREPADPSKPHARKRGPGRHTGEDKDNRVRKTVREVVGDFGLFRSVPRSLKTEVERYLREREANPEWFDSTALVARRSLKRLYSVLHIRPGERAQKILFDDDPPADSRLSVFKRLMHISDPAEQAKAITEARLPFRLAVSVVSEMNPAVLTALVERMSPQEVINNLGVLRRHGGLDNPDVRLMVDLKLEQARTSKRVSTFKAEKAIEAVPVDDALRASLETVADEQIKAKGRIRRSTALLIDKSNSMDTGIDVGKRIAAMISAICEKELVVYAFDTMAYPITAAGKDWASWKRAFEGINANGETSVGVSLEMMRRRKQVVEQVVIVTDEEEYNPPFFIDSVRKYRQELGADPAICFVKVPDSTTRLEDQCKRAGIAFSVFEFTGDYYALPNLVALLEPPSQLDLLMEIMDYPLPARK
jgi:hypothetical protein